MGFMEKTLLILMLGALPAIALAHGDSGGHVTKGDRKIQNQDMAGMDKSTWASMAGKPGDPIMVSRTVEIVMDDSMRFTPDKISAKAGETIRFFVKNAGNIPHKMVIGTMDELKEHAEMMRKMPGMPHAGPNMIALGQGQRGGLIWQFDKAGTFDFACLVPGHWEAGMAGKVMVE
ncbi:cupredoxin domain-containing protein [Thiobacillus sp.]